MVASRSESEKADPHFLLGHIQLGKHVDYRALFDEDDPKTYEFIKLLETINMRASEVSSLQPNFPKMDLSALYCLGITIQEYVRYLTTDILTQKRALEGKSPVSTFCASDEIKSRTLEAVIQNFRSQASAEEEINN